MRPDLQKTADLVTFTEEIYSRKVQFFFCAVKDAIQEIMLISDIVNFFTWPICALQIRNWLLMVVVSVWCHLDLLKHEQIILLFLINVSAGLDNYCIQRTGSTAVCLREYLKFPRLAYLRTSFPTWVWFTRFLFWLGKFFMVSKSSSLPCVRLHNSYFTQYDQSYYSVCRFCLLKLVRCERKWKYWLDIF